MSLLTTLTRAKTSVLAVLPHMRDRRVPFALKAATAALGVLIISPLDIFGDIPVIGLLDDAVLLTLLSMAFVAVARAMVERPARATARSSSLATK